MSLGWQWRVPRRRRCARRWRNTKDLDEEQARPHHEGPSRFKSWRLIWGAIVKVARPYFTNPATRFQGFALSLVIIVLLLVERAMDIVFTKLGGQYMTALQQKDEEGFYNGLKNFAYFLVVLLPVGVMHGFAIGCLRLQWSASLTRHYAGKYLGSNGVGGAFYRLTLTEEIDNPDQRIVDESESFVSTVLQLVTSVTNNLLKIITFGSLLYQISPKVFTSTLAYVMFGTTITVHGFGSRLMRVEQAVAKEKATLRYSLIRVRENAESIAFFGGGGSEWIRFESFFNKLFHTLSESMVLHQLLGTLLKSFGFATFAVAPLLVGPSYLRGEVEFGAIMQTSMAFNAIKDGLSFFMHNLPQLSSLVVHAERLNALDHCLKEQAVGDPGITRITVEEHTALDRPVLELESVTLQTPARPGAEPQTLLKELSLQVHDGMSVLVVGSSGIGKSSLLRGIAGLWREGKGFVRRCGGSSVFFMPQRPYMFLGTLREQLLYPEVQDLHLSDEKLRESLREVNLGYLLDRYGLDDTQAWASVLSLGEQQRINFVRVLVRPGLQLALIDEGTSACDPANERHLYNLLSTRLRSFVSIGHRPALRRYHTHAMWLRRPEHPSDGGACDAATCTLLPMEQYEQLASKEAE